MVIFFSTCSSLGIIAPRRQKTRKATAFSVDRSAPRTEALLQIFRGLDIMVFFFSFFQFSHLKGFVRPLGGPKSEPSPFLLSFFPSILLNPPFSLQIHSAGHFKDQNGGRGMERLRVGMTEFCTPPTHSVPCTNLGLSLLSPPPPDSCCKVSCCNT